MIATGRFAVYFLTIYTPIVLGALLGGVWKWRRHALQVRAWRSDSVDPPKKTLLSPTAEALVLSSGILLLAGFIAYLVIATWGQTTS